MIRLMVSLELLFRKEIKPIINSQFINVARAVDLGVGGVDFVIDQYNIRLRNVFKKNYTRIANVFYEKVAKEITDVKSVASSETKGLLEDFWRALGIWINLQTAEKVNKINRTTKRAIKNIIEKGIEEGKSNRDIAKKIRKVGNISSKSRAATIARTETHTVATYSTHTAIEKTRIETEKEWVTAKDARVRIDHNLADGERVPIDEMFMNTGEPMEYPGDPSGSAWNVVNCRCVVIYHTVNAAIKSICRIAA